MIANRSLPPSYIGLILYGWTPFVTGFSAAGTVAVRISGSGGTYTVTTSGAGVTSTVATGGRQYHDDAYKTSALPASREQDAPPAANSTGNRHGFP